MAASPGAAVYLNSVEGNVQSIHAVSNRAVRAVPNKPIAQGDTIAVSSSGNAEILVRDGSVLRIAEGSRLKVLSIEPRAVQFFLESGKVYVKFAGLRDYPLFLSTPSAALDAYDRSTFRIDIMPSGDTEVSVYSGQLYVAQPKGRMTIAAGSRLVMKQDGGPPVYTVTKQADAFDVWNRKKDGAEPRTQNAPPQGAPSYPGTASVPPDQYTSSPVTVSQEYVYVTPAPVWGYSYYYYPRGYPPYPWPWYGPYYRAWGYRPWYGYHGRGGPPPGPGPGRGPGPGPRR